MTLVVGLKTHFTTTYLSERSMIFNQGKVAGGLVDELLEVIHKYDETLYTSTVIGCLELVKQQLINDATEENNG
jgi:hypothetical protein